MSLVIFMWYMQWLATLLLVSLRQNHSRDTPASPGSIRICERPIPIISYMILFHFFKESFKNISHNKT